MKQAKIQLEAEYNLKYGRTVLYDRETGLVLFVATEVLADYLEDPFELAEMIVEALQDVVFNPAQASEEDEDDE